MTKRKRFLLLSFCLLFLITMTVWCYFISDDGKALILEKRLKWSIMPHAMSPGGADRMYFYNALQPEWEELIQSGYVSWYVRDFTGLVSDEISVRAFWKDINEASIIPKPFDIIAQMDVEFVEPRIEGASSPLKITKVYLLVHEDYHAQIDSLLQMHFKTTGAPGEQPKYKDIMWWNLEDYKMTEEVQPDGTRTFRPRW